MVLLDSFLLLAHQRQLIKRLKVFFHVCDKKYILYVDGKKLDGVKTLVDYNIPKRQARYITTVDELYTKNGFWIL